MAGPARAVVVPAAGRSLRYRAAGILTPKPLLRFYWRGRRATMLEHALGAWGLRDDVVVVCRGHDLEAFRAALPRRWTMVPAEEETRGQAESVLLGLEAAGLDDANVRVNVANCDAGSAYPLDVFEAQAAGAPSAALVFDGNGETAYSYVDGYPEFTRVAEKRPIGPWAVAGFYTFAEAGCLYDALKSLLTTGVKPPPGGEVYLSGAWSAWPHSYRHLAVYMPRGMLRVWGTPEDLARDGHVTLGHGHEADLLRRMR